SGRSSRMSAASTRAGASCPSPMSAETISTRGAGATTAHGRRARVASGHGRLPAQGEGGPAGGEVAPRRPANGAARARGARGRASELGAEPAGGPEADAPLRPGAAGDGPARAVGPGPPARRRGRAGRRLGGELDGL